jgi:hypothetical protein
MFVVRFELLDAQTRSGHQATGDQIVAHAPVRLIADGFSPVTTRYEPIVVI